MEKNLVSLINKYDKEINQSCNVPRHKVIDCFKNDLNDSWECQKEISEFINCIENFDKSFRKKYLNQPLK